MIRFVVFAFGVLFGLRLDVFLAQSGVLPTSALLFIGALGVLSLARLEEIPRLLESPLWRICAAFLLLSMLGFVGPYQDADSWEAVRKSCLSLIYVSAWLLILSDSESRRAVTAALVTAIAVAVGLNVYELAHLGTWSSVLGRSAGTFMNPNLAALGILAATAALEGQLRSNALYGLVLAAAGVGILVTFSRGGVALWAALCLYVLFLSGRFRPRDGALAFGGAAAVVVAAPFLLPREILEVPTVAQRIEVIHGGGFNDYSSHARADLVDAGVRLFTESPLFGHGPARARHIQNGTVVEGLHNQYLAVGVNFGLAGLALWLGYLLRLARAPRWPLFIVVAGAGLTFHGLLFDRQLLLGLAVLHASPEEDPAP